MTYSIPAQCQEQETAYERFVRLCDNPPPPTDALRELMRRSWFANWIPVIPKDNCLPSTARAILDLDKPKLNDKQQLEGQGISRAVDRLNSGEHRYGYTPSRMNDDYTV